MLKLLILSLPVFLKSTDIYYDITVDIALNEPTNWSSNPTHLNGYSAVDGIFKSTLCFSMSSSSNSDLWWMVNFSRQYFIRTIRLLNGIVEMKNATFLTSPSDDQPDNRRNFIICAHYSLKIYPRKSITVSCENGPLYSKSLIVETRSSSSLTICEIEIWTMRKIDTNKQVTQSHHQANAHKGNNEISDGTWGGVNHCTWTSRVHPSWFKIDLSTPSEIHAISLVNRDHLFHRLGHLKILLSNSSTNPPWQNEVLCRSIGDASSYLTRRCPKFTSARFISLYKHILLSDPGLTVCEIDVFGSRPDDSPNVSWIIETGNNIRKVSSDVKCQAKNTFSINLQEFQMIKMNVQVKGILLIESCRKESYILTIVSQNIPVECKLKKFQDGYYTERDMLDTCEYDCDCSPSFCSSIHLTIFPFSFRSLNKEFYVIINDEK